jgi:hypothetical protein
MDPIAIIGMLTAAFAAAGPVLKLIVSEAEIVGADVTANKSALQTFEDALVGLQTAFASNPLPAPVKAA